MSIIKTLLKIHEQAGQLQYELMMAKKEASTAKAELVAIKSAINPEIEKAPDEVKKTVASQSGMCTYGLYEPDITVNISTAMGQAGELLTQYNKSIVSLIELGQKGGY